MLTHDVYGIVMVPDGSCKLYISSSWVPNMQAAAS